MNQNEFESLQVAIHGRPWIVEHLLGCNVSKFAPVKSFPFEFSALTYNQTAQMFDNFICGSVIFVRLLQSRVLHTFNFN